MSKAFKNKIRDERTIDFLFSVKIRSSIVDIRVSFTVLLFTVFPKRRFAREIPPPRVRYSENNITSKYVKEIYQF